MEKKDSHKKTHKKHIDHKIEHKHDHHKHDHHKPDHHKPDHHKPDHHKPEHHKHHKHEAHKHKKKQKQNPWIIAAVIILVLALIWSVYHFSTGPDSDTSDTSDTYDDVQETEGVAATVNDVPIMMSEIDQKFNMLPDMYRQVIPKQMILNQSIDEKIMMQEAKSKSIVVSDEEVDTVIDTLLAQNQMTLEEFQQQLTQTGADMVFIKNLYKTQLIINKLLEQEVLNKLSLPEEDIKKYYDKNTEEFMMSGQVKASHILVNTTEKAQEIMDQIEKGADFAVLAKEHSIDTYSGEQGGDLGFFGKGKMVPEFENAAFSLDIGEISEPVESQFGYHIIKLTDKQEAKQQSFEEVKDQINQMLTESKQGEAIQDYVKGLRAKSKIVVFYKEEVVAPIVSIGDSSDTVVENQTQPVADVSIG